MSKQQFSFSPEEAIQNEIEILKLKLEVEFGAQVFVHPQMPPPMALKWLQDVYDFEIQKGSKLN